MAKRFDALRIDAESLIRLTSAQELSNYTLELSNYTLESVLHELLVHQVELEMQNESLRQTQLALEESRDRYANLYNFAPVAYITLTRDFRISEINLTGAALLGEERKQVLHSRFNRFVSWADGDRWHLLFHDLIQNGKKQSFELLMQRQDGSTWQARFDCVPMVADDVTSTVRIALTDMTESLLLAQEQRIAAIAFESQVGMMITDPDGVIIRVNQAFTRLSGYTADELIGCSASVLKSGRHDSCFYQQMWASLKEKGSWMGEIWDRHKNGTIYVQWLSINAVINPEQHITHFVGSFSDIRHKQNEAGIDRVV